MELQKQKIVQDFLKKILDDKGDVSCRFYFTPSFINYNTYGVLINAIANNQYCINQEGLCVSKLGMKIDIINLSNIISLLTNYELFLLSGRFILIYKVSNTSLNDIKYYDIIQEGQYIQDIMNDFSIELKKYLEDINVSNEYKENAKESIDWLLKNIKKL